MERIQNKGDYYRFLKLDKKAMGIEHECLAFCNPFLIDIEIWNFIKALRISIEYIYNNIKTYENYFSKVIQYCKNWLKEETSCEINKEIIKLLIVIIKFSLQREDLFSYLKQEFYSNQSFYSRRIYVLFIKYSFDKSNFKYITFLLSASKLLKIESVNSVKIIGSLL